jgi:hypothetical protein
MQMIHGLPGAAPVVGHKAVAGGDARLIGHGSRHPLQVPEERLIPIIASAQARDVLLGHNQDMRGRLRGDILEGNGLFVLVYELRGNLPRDYFTEDAVCHENRNL